MKDTLTEVQKTQKDEVLHILLLNLAHCHLKKNNPKEAIKTATESIEYNKSNPKAYFRLGLAQKLNGDFEDAKASLATAIKLAPNDVNLRNEYKSLTDLKMTKEQEWQKKMSGFYTSAKMAKIEQKDEEEAILREKLQRKHFGI